MKNSVLIIGLIFPLLSWLTFILCAIQSCRTGKNPSGIYIPFIGPVLIDIWILTEGLPAWMLILPWVLDIGTVFFIRVLPGLIIELWQTSVFTRICFFVGVKANERVEVSLHRSGRYLMKRQWQRPPNEPGITALSETGSFEATGKDFILTSHTGSKRVLEKKLSEWLVIDNDAEGFHNLNGWLLKQE